MRVLGLDLALSSTGFSIVDEEYNLIAYGTIQTSKKNNTEEERLYIIGKKINELMKEYSITDVCIESSFKSVNIKTTQQLAKLLGIASYLAIDNKLNIKTINPSSARKLIIGDGSCKKEDVAEYIRNNYWDIGEYSNRQTKTQDKTSDIFDSMLLCIVFLKKYKLDKKYKINSNK